MDGKTWMIPAAFLAAAVGGLLRSQYERDHFVVEETRIVSKKIRRERTLVFLSDLHDKEFGPKNARLIQAVREVRPDAVLIGGDSMIAKDGKCSLEVTEQLLAKLSMIAPIYYGNGNHEQRIRRDPANYGDAYKRFREMLDRHSVVYLSNESVNIGDDLRISGLDIEQRYYRDFRPEKMTEEYVGESLGWADRTRFQILMAHSPLFFDAYAGWGADLSLAGHFHGGTIRLPFLGGVMTPQFQFFLPWCAGTFEKNGKYMLVSRGLGTHSINIRFLNKPQVAVIRLLPGEL